MLRIMVEPREAASIILGIFGSSPFYEGFHKEVMKKPGNDISVEKASYLVKKIRSHWNKDDTKYLKRLSKENEFIKFTKLESHSFNEVRTCIFNLLNKTKNTKGIQNTKLSKLLYVYSPELIPMIDENQGKFILKKYNNKSRDHLKMVIEEFHSSISQPQNKKLIKRTKKILKEYDINVTSLRILELLIWVQELCRIKEIKKILVSQDTV